MLWYEQRQVIKYTAWFGSNSKETIPISAEHNATCLQNIVD
ncbi:hypothetical protein NEISICOT_03501 [Neisseria sicca ATCC 29256]|uniref:Uncharacterized protein n=1 Tax=Neisseria sicca ATCC 29256 TaxID=547045 RepID=C6MAB9_NEISI|nr:hypothetical protein NEISICOT_03501 [Neisseria sicca ATCC 29256]